MSVACGPLKGFGGKDLTTRARCYEQRGWWSEESHNTQQKLMMIKKVSIIITSS